MMDKIKLTLVGIVVMIASWAMVATQTYTEAVLNIGPIHLSLPYILGYASLIFLVWLWTPILESIVKFFMNGTVMKVIFFIVLIFGILATIDILLNAWFNIDIGIISGIKSAWGG
jgi:hypothetical protein